MQQKTTTQQLWERAQQVIQTIERDYNNRWFSIDQNRKQGLQNLKKALLNSANNPNKYFKEFIKECKIQAEYTGVRGILGSTFCKEIAYFIYETHELFAQEAKNLRSRYEKILNSTVVDTIQSQDFSIQQFAVACEITSDASEFFLLNYDFQLFKNLIEKKYNQFILTEINIYFSEIFLLAYEHNRCDFIADILTVDGLAWKIFERECPGGLLKTVFQDSYLNGNREVHWCLASSSIFHRENFLLYSLDDEIKKARECKDLKHLNFHLDNIKIYLSSLRSVLAYYDILRWAKKGDNPLKLHQLLVTALKFSLSKYSSDLLHYIADSIKDFPLLFKEVRNLIQNKLGFFQVYSFFSIPLWPDLSIPEDIKGLIKKEVIAVCKEEEKYSSFGV